LLTLRSVSGGASKRRFGSAGIATLLLVAMTVLLVAFWPRPGSRPPRSSPPGADTASSSVSAGIATEREVEVRRSERDLEAGRIRVLDREGRPIAGACVGRLDANDELVVPIVVPLAGLLVGPSLFGQRLVAYAAGYVPSAEFRVGSTEADVEVVLDVGAALRVVVTDTDDAPIEGVAVAASSVSTPVRTNAGFVTPDGVIPRADEVWVLGRTDGDGCARLCGIPSGATVYLGLSKHGWYQSGGPISVRDLEHGVDRGVECQMSPIFAVLVRAEGDELLGFGRPGPIGSGHEDYRLGLPRIAGELADARNDVDWAMFSTTPPSDPVALEPVFRRSGSTSIELTPQPLADAEVVVLHASGRVPDDFGLLEVRVLDGRGEPLALETGAIRANAKTGEWVRSRSTTAVPLGHEIALPEGRYELVAEFRYAASALGLPLTVVVERGATHVEVLHARADLSQVRLRPTSPAGFPLSSFLFAVESEFGGRFAGANISGYEVSFLAEAGVPLDVELTSPRFGRVRQTLIPSPGDHVFRVPLGR
jgi:hypothetical protein